MHTTFKSITCGVWVPKPAQVVTINLMLRAYFTETLAQCHWLPTISKMFEVTTIFLDKVWVFYF